MTTTTTDALAERERLRLEARRAREARIEHGARADEIRVELRTIPRERKAALREAARSGKPAKVDGFDQREAELTAEAERAREAAQAASAAVRAAEVELQRLHADCFPEFANGAEEITREAAAKLAAIEAGYREAFDAIERARAAWSLIVSDRERVRRERSSPGDRAGARFKAEAISPPPESPLRPPAEVFGAGPVRPPEIEPLADAA